MLVTINFFDQANLLAMRANVLTAQNPDGLLNGYIGCCARLWTSCEHPPSATN